MSDEVKSVKFWILKRERLFLPDELLPVDEAETEAAEAAEFKGKAVAPMALTSLLLHDPAEMSLAGPVAEVSDIFSSSNSAGPVKEVQLIVLPS